MLTYKGKDFLLNGEKFSIYSGAIHYFRVLPEYWADRLAKLKAAGFNTVETYVCWNLHEPEKGKFDFSGRLDLAAFLQTAQRLGLYALVRPGPYICAEWDNGGLPAWLAREPGMQVRCGDPRFMAHVADFFHRLLPALAPLQVSRGGNILAMQVENEYGSYGNDKAYLRFLRDLMQDQGIDCLLYTSDGPTVDMLSGGRLDGVLPTLNFGSGAGEAFSLLAGEDIPKMCMEFWCGWFDHWGEQHHTRNPESVVAEIRSLLEQDASFNVYMFHGGTNFGFTAGANRNLRYRPTVTSYDYGAPLNEYGDYTPLYYALRQLLCSHRGITPPPLPPRPQLQAPGRVELSRQTSLLGQALGQIHHSPLPRFMEDYGQSHGLIYYETALPGPTAGGWLTCENLHDLAWVFVDGKIQGSLAISCPRRKLEQLKPKNRLPLPPCPAGTKIGVLVEAMGRVNYGPGPMDRKGITGLRLGGQYLMDFTVTTLPLDDLSGLDFTRPAGGYPRVYRGTFTVDSQDECFVDLCNFTKGMVYVNGFNLGRYWNRGPQQTLYLPGVLLHPGKSNEITVLELSGCAQPAVCLTDSPRLG